MIDLMHAECVAAMRTLADRSVDHTITDPPYSEKTHAKGKRYKRGRFKVPTIAWSCDGSGVLPARAKKVRR